MHEVAWNSAVQHVFSSEYLLQLWFLDTLPDVVFFFFFSLLSHVVMSSTRRLVEGMPGSYARQIAVGRGSRARMP